MKVEESENHGVEYDVSPAAKAIVGGYCLFSHDADIGVSGQGATKAEAFENAAKAMTAAIVDPSTINARDSVTICCNAPDDGTLLIDWLNAIVFEMATRSMLFREFHVDLRGSQLTAEALGERLDPVRHAPAVEVKGATYTALRVERGPDDVWTAQCVIDV